MFAAKDRPLQDSAVSSRPATFAAPARISSNLCQPLQNTRPLFSYSYRILLPQLPCFEIHAGCPGGGGNPGFSNPRTLGSGLRPFSKTGSNPSKMNTYAKCAANPRAMNTSKSLDLKSRVMNTYKKMGGGEVLLLPNGLMFAVRTTKVEGADLVDSNGREERCYGCGLYLQPT
jgi:hypothetical protein